MPSDYYLNYPCIINFMMAEKSRNSFLTVCRLPKFAYITVYPKTKFNPGLSPGQSVKDFISVI